MCEGHAKDSQYLSSIGLSHFQPCLPLTLDAYPPRTWPSLGNNPGLDNTYPVKDLATTCFDIPPIWD